MQTFSFLTDLSNTMRLVGALNWMPAPAQIRYVVMAQDLKQEFRLILPADALLVKRFPQYGYFWNLFCDRVWTAVRKLLSQDKWLIP